MIKRFVDVAALIAAQPPLSADASLADRMRRLCTAARDCVGASGVGLTLVTEDVVRGLAVASDPHAEQLEELQFTLGEGPCVDAFADRQPVLVPDLDASAMARWPGYAPAVYALGVRAVFAFPLQIGAARLGVLDMFRAHPAMLSRSELSHALTFADVATSMLLDENMSMDENGDDGLSDAFGSRAAVFQAQGMVMLQLGVTLAVALARIRAHAYSNNRRLSAVAADIVAGHLRLDRPTT